MPQFAEWCKEDVFDDVMKISGKGVPLYVLQKAGTAIGIEVRILVPFNEKILRPVDVRDY
ncbi:hypothetical protein [Neobacillus sp. LXY-1]|uniref:hypothetical protein n=1 Tax=Neobacillus sp. LXY-1 TaxID=3379133 RepID=UPI003EE26360